DRGSRLPIDSWDQASGDDSYGSSRGGWRGYEPLSGSSTILTDFPRICENFWNSGEVAVCRDDGAVNAGLTHDRARSPLIIRTGSLPAGPSFRKTWLLRRLSCGRQPPSSSVPHNIRVRRDRSADGRPSRRADAISQPAGPLPADSGP